MPEKGDEKGGIPRLPGSNRYAISHLGFFFTWLAVSLISTGLLNL
jgi:hypothetical protein